MHAHPTTVLCLAGDVKGQRFMIECKNEGARVFVLTRQSLQGDPDWPYDAVDEFFYMPTLTNREHVINAVSYLARTEYIDRIVPMDDFDVEIAAWLREHLRTPGMGETTSNYFRDKLAMRMATSEKGILCPPFVSIFHRAEIHDFLQNVPAPWVLKPRSQAGAAGIKKFHHAQDVWDQLEKLGDQQSHYLLEQFIPGDIFHVDAITTEGQVSFEEVSRYGKPPLEIIQSGGIFLTSLQHREGQDTVELKKLGREVLKTLGFKRGVTHTEFIKSRTDGRFYFLETAARVGGAYIADVIEKATGINLWTEWAKIEIAGGKRPYELPAHRQDYAGIVLCLARQEWPDLSTYNDPEIVYRVHKKNHAGLILASADYERLQWLLNDYSQRFGNDFLAAAPQYEKIER